MAIQKLDHVNLRTTQLNSMIHWYTTILGLHHGEKPKSASPGAWLYAGSTAIIHLVEIKNSDAIGAEADLKLEHFALTATDCAGFEAILQENKQQYKRVDQTSFNTIQINLWDPDGNHIHVDFVMDENS